jgi:TPR repeat protein
LPGDSFTKADAWWARVSPLAKISSTNYDRLGGVVHIGATNYHTLDYGEVFSLSPEEKAAAIASAQAALDAKRQTLQANAVASDQKAADNGDPLGQLYMGRRYRDGDGVPKDLVKAKEWFAKSAAQGNAQAAGALENMKAADR